MADLPTESNVVPFVPRTARAPTEDGHASSTGLSGAEAGNLAAKVYCERGNCPLWRGEMIRAIVTLVDEFQDDYVEAYLRAFLLEVSFELWRLKGRASLALDDVSTMRAELNALRRKRAGRTRRRRA